MDPSSIPKRVFENSSDEDDSVHPRTPKRRSTIVYSLEKNDVPSTFRPTSLTLPPRAEDVVGRSADEDSVTPPLTPTRRSSPRGQPESVVLNRQDTLSMQRSPTRLRRANSAAASYQVSAMVGTPTRTRGSRASDENCQSTGLTPSMTRMFKENKDNENSKPAKSTKAYTTPTKPTRTMHNALQKSDIPKALNLLQAATSTSCSSSTLSNSSSSLVSPALAYYQDAKALFRPSAEPLRLVGRVEERAKVTAFFQNHVLTPKAGSLYISGQPGTGKSALLKEIMRDMNDTMRKSEHKIQIMTVNCMSVKDPRQVYQKLLDQMGHEGESSPKENLDKLVEDLVLNTNDTKKVMYLAVLDEIDHLLSKDQEVLYKLFEWSSANGSRMSLIGIANALDLTDRFLPRLRAKDCEPELLNFNPYQVAEIRDIIMDRLFSLEGPVDSSKAASTLTSADGSTKPRMAPLMQRPAIELCARKVAAGTGDLRKALHICRKAFEMVETETKKKDLVVQKPLRATSPLQELKFSNFENCGQHLPRNTGTSTTVATLVRLNESSESMTIQTAPKVTVAHVNKALIATLGSPNVQKIKGLNMHQKILMTMIVAMHHKGKINECVMSKVVDEYTLACRASKKVGAVSRSEAQDLVNMLEATGLITLAKAKEERLRKVGLQVRESEVLEGVRDQELIQTILAKEGM